MWTLPIIFWLLTALLLTRKGYGWRAAFLVAAIFFGCLTTTFIELLSYFHLLTMIGLSFCWAGIIAIVLLLHWKLKKPWKTWGNYNLSPLETGLVGGISLICLATFVTAIVSPPNNWDSMTYHMSRVVHWLQNRSVEHYPTHILRQIELNPWAEFAIAQFQALSGGDRYANLVQWFSMVGSIVGASLIAEQLGGDRRAQLLTAVTVSTIPMGILQSSSTQNNYVVAFWLVCLAWTGLQFIRGKELKWAVMAGASLGLAVLTKGTAYLFAFPFIVWLAFVVLRDVPRQAAAVIFCLVLPFFLLNMHHYQRNLSVFSSSLGSKEAKFANEDISAGTLVSNVIRNTAMHFGSPFAGLNAFVGNSVAKLHKGLNIDLNDPKTTLSGTEFNIYKPVRHEDTDGNFLHVVFVASSLLTLLFFVSFRKVIPSINGYVFAVAAGFFLFCLALKWQPWSSRLLLPLFVLGAPVIGVIAVKCWRPRLVTPIALVLLLTALPWAFSNVTRPLIWISEERKIFFPLLTTDRNQLYFVNNPGLYKQYEQIAKDIVRQNATNIGLVLGRDTWEYPLWVMIKQLSPSPVRLEHTDVENLSRLTGKANFTPDIYVKIY